MGFILSTLQASIQETNKIIEIEIWEVDTILKINKISHFLKCILQIQ